ncbi:MAG: hypothetical protein GYA55_11815 [SAR324 cluster bacterium]|uniref:Chromosomal replication initiator protein DnaA domain-containing protein n=1 Tax=SAR324 cluster bacterium TaxID=2024889 RepID=A0A7X9IMB3_9DELT|nr:hypothetical protein [SAR324 cluster bacterium]
MNQIPLPLGRKIAYSPDNFVLHSGIKALVDRTLNEIVQDRFSIVYIKGGRRSGKTHLSLYLALAASTKGLYPILLEGAFLENEMKHLDLKGGVDSSYLVLIDDIENYFLQPSYSDSGAFVHFVEYLRVRKASLVIFSSRCIDELPVDEHVRSRLLPGGANEIREPARTEMLELLHVMAQQRGILLKQRKREFLLKRMRTEIPAIEQFLESVLEFSSGDARSLHYKLLRAALDKGQGTK